MEQQYEVTGRIYYKNPNSPRYRTKVEPGEMLVTFPHLEDWEIELLIRTGYIRPVASAQVEEEE